jgi:hypothetical protein
MIRPKTNNQDTEILNRGHALLSKMDVIANRMTSAIDNEIHCFCETEVLGDEMRLQLFIRSNDDPEFDWSSLRLLLTPYGGKLVRLERLDNHGRLFLTNIPADNYKIKCIKQHNRHSLNKLAKKKTCLAEDKIAAESINKSATYPKKPLSASQETDNEEFTVTSDNNDLTCTVSYYHEEAILFFITSENMALSGSTAYINIIEHTNKHENVTTLQSTLKKYPGEPLLYCNLELEMKLFDGENTSFEIWHDNYE